MTTVTAQEDKLLTMQEVADRYSVPLATVRKWRVTSYGPQGFAVGRYVRYRLSDCLAFEDAQSGAGGAG